jgi:hypothetical protein
LNFLDSFIGACSGASTVESREWGDVDFGFDLRVGVVALAFAVPRRQSQNVDVKMSMDGITSSYPSRGPVTVHRTMVLPIVTRLEPSLDGCVLIEAVMRRSSFHRRPSCRRRVCEYVERVSSGMAAVRRQQRCY